MAVTVKHIDRNAIGHDHDWEGNNAAYLPILQKGLYRKCPYA